MNRHEYGGRAMMSYPNELLEYEGFDINLDPADEEHMRETEKNLRDLNPRSMDKLEKFTVPEKKQAPTHICFHGFDEIKFYLIAMIILLVALVILEGFNLVKPNVTIIANTRTD